MNKEISKMLTVLQKQNPLATFLSKQTLSQACGYLNTGSKTVNAIMSGKLDGGFPKNRVTVVAGESMTGKTFFAMGTAKNAINEGLIPVVFDAEGAWDKKSCQDFGLDPEEVLHVPVFTLEKCRNQVHLLAEYIKENNLQNKYVFIIDSISQLEAEQNINRQEKDNTSIDMGSTPRGVKSLVKTCTRVSIEMGITVIIIAHVYDDPGAMFPSIEKNIPGGKALRYLPSVVLQLARSPLAAGDAKVKDGDGKLTAGQKKIGGVILRGLTVKNRFIKSHLEAESYLSFETGLHPYFGLIQLCEQFGVVHKDKLSYVITSTGENVGRYTAWHRDENVWNKLLPLLQKEMDAHWPYGTTGGLEDEEAMEKLVNEEDE